MQQSFLERVFPKPKRASVTEYNEYRDYNVDSLRASSSSSTNKIVLQDSPARSPRRPSPGIQRLSPSALKTSSNASKQLKPAPTSASTSHHEDPFLVVDRAAKALQATIQTLLDYQNRALTGRQDDGYADESMSQSSATPTPSATTPSRSMTASGAMPIRQPAPKKLTLKSVRRGIARKMFEFDQLKEEEYRISENEARARRNAWKKAHRLQEKKDAVQHELQALEERTKTSGAQVVRGEARVVEQEIRELEDKLMELRVCHRHLVARAEEIESADASELSSFKGTLAMVDRETKSFLQHPPVATALTPRSMPALEADMYVLRPERRTIEMAKEQWAAEADVLDSHKADIEKEMVAFRHGSKLWDEVIARVTGFENELARYTRAIMSGASSVSGTSDQSDIAEDPTSRILTELDSSLQFLDSALNHAEAENWNILICAIGAEVEAFKHARSLLAPETETATKTSTSEDHGNDLISHSSSIGSHSGSPTDILQRTQPEIPNALPAGPLDSSNESLKQTINSLNSTAQSNPQSLSSSARFPQQRTLYSSARSSASPSASTPKLPASNQTTSSNPSGDGKGKAPTAMSARYESEDDDPDPAFFLSQ